MLSIVGERERNQQWGIANPTWGLCACTVAYICNTATPVRLSVLQLHMVHSLQDNVCDCNRVPQCIYEMSVEKLIHCIYIITITGTPFHCVLLLLDIENVWELEQPTCDRVADCTAHCRSLSVGVTAVYLHQELLRQLLWLNRPLHLDFAVHQPGLDVILHHQV